MTTRRSDACAVDRYEQIQLAVFAALGARNTKASMASFVEKKKA